MLWASGDIGIRLTMGGGAFLAVALRLAADSDGLDNRSESECTGHNTDKAFPASHADPSTLYYLMKGTKMGQAMTTRAQRYAPPPIRKKKFGSAAGLLHLRRTRDPAPMSVNKGHTIHQFKDGWLVNDGKGRFVRFFKGPQAAALASRCALDHDNAR